MIIIEKNIKKIREKANLTQKQLCKITEISLGTLKDWEQGKIPKAINDLCKIKIALNCSWEDMFEEKENND